MNISTRHYRQVARANATVEARRRIILTYLGMLTELGADRITLDELATRADTTRQTLIRYFGGKDGLMQAAGEQISQDVHARRSTPPDATLERHIAALIADYDETGDIIVQLLAQEARLPMLRSLLDIGRKGHREWLAKVFGRWLVCQLPQVESRRIDQLYAATDVNTWKLFRRDFGYSAATTAEVIADMARRLLDVSPASRE